MALVEETLFGVHDKVSIALQRLRTFEPAEGYYLAFSGGKDSQCVYHLCKEAGVKFDAHYSLTTVDPPEVIYFMREHYPDVIVDRHDTTMWKLIVKKGMPPTRMVRYCCDELKEGGGRGRVMVTGVRWLGLSRCALSLTGIRSTSRHTSVHSKRCLLFARTTESPTIYGKPLTM